MDESTLAYALARIAWHEWAHALSLMTRRRLIGGTDRPAWLSEEVYELVRRVAGWNQ
jgi:hypothetical protein